MRSPVFFDATRLPPRLAFVEREFPFPLGLTYSRIWHEIDADQPIPATLQMKDAFEALLKFAASAAVADCLTAEPPRELAGKLVSTLFKPLAVGDWFTLLEDALRPVRTDPAHTAKRLLPALADIFLKPNGDRTDVGLILIGTGSRMGFVRWRNTELAHGAFRKDRAFYVQQVVEWLPKLNRCLEALRPVADGWALRGVTPGGERIDWTGDLALSHVEHHRHEAWGEPIPLVLESRDGKSLPFGPLLSMQTCAHPSCRQPSAFYFEGNEYAKEKHRTFFLEYFVGQTQTAKDWHPVRELAAHLPEKFAFERVSYDHRKLAGEVKLVFRDVESEYRRPDYLLDALWEARDRHPTGYYLWEGEQGVGKSFAVHGLERDGDDRGVTVLRYHVLPGDAANYQTFIGELGQRVREKLDFATQEIQTLVARHAELPKQFAVFVGEVMRANGLNGLIVAIDGLDELRDPAKPSGAVLTDFLPPVEDLPRGCLVVLSTRGAVCSRVRDRLTALGIGSRPDAVRCAIVPASEPNRELVRRRLRDHGPDVLRSPAAVERVLELSGGVFLYAVHFARALAAGAYSGVEELPEAQRFYADYLARLRDRVGPDLYEMVYEKALLLLAAAQVPVTRAQLHGWGVPAGRLAFALRDVSDFVSEIRHRSWHEGLGDDTEPRYAIAHEAFVRYVSTDAEMITKLKAAHGTIAGVALRRNDTRWEGLDAADHADLYDVRFVLHHTEAAGMSDEGERLRGDNVLPWAIAQVAYRLGELARCQLAADLYDQCVIRCRDLVENRGRAGLADGLALALMNKGVALCRMGRLVEAVGCQDEAIRILRDLVGNRGRPELADYLAIGLTSKGEMLRQLGRSVEAVGCQDEAIRILRDLVGNRGRVGIADHLAGALMNKGNALQGLGRSVEAVGCYDEAIAIRRDLVENRGRAELAGGLAGTLVSKGETLRQMGRLVEAVGCHDEAIRILRDLVGNRGRPELANELASALMNKGNALQGLGRSVEAVRCYDEAIAIRRDLVENRGRAELADDLAVALMNKGEPLRQLGRLGEAVGCHDEATRILRDLVENRGRDELADHLAMALMNKGNILQELGRSGEAVGCHDEAIRIYRDLAENQARDKPANDLAMALMNKGVALQSAMRLDEAATLYDEAITIYRILFDIPRYELLPNLLVAYANRSDLAVAQNDWPAAANITLVSITAFATKQRATEITDPDQQHLGHLVGPLRRLTPEQRDLLLAAAGENADQIRELLGET